MQRQEAQTQLQNALEQTKQEQEVETATASQNDEPFQAQVRALAEEMTKSAVSAMTQQYKTLETTFKSTLQELREERASHRTANSKPAPADRGQPATDDDQPLERTSGHSAASEAKSSSPLFAQNTRHVASAAQLANSQALHATKPTGTAVRRGRGEATPRASRASQGNMWRQAAHTHLASEWRTPKVHEISPSRDFQRADKSGAIQPRTNRRESEHGVANPVADPSVARNASPAVDDIVTLQLDPQQLAEVNSALASGDVTDTSLFFGPIAETEADHEDHSGSNHDEVQKVQPPTATTAPPSFGERDTQSPSTRAAVAAIETEEQKLLARLERLQVC